MIEWTEQAVRQLEQAHDYIALTNNDEVAYGVVSQIIARVESLERFPLAGRAGRVRGTRELVISNSPFITVYAIQGSRVVILAVYHGAQRWPEVL